MKLERGASSTMKLERGASSTMKLELLIVKDAGLDALML